MNKSKRLSTWKVALLSILVILVIGVVIIATLPAGAQNSDLTAKLSEIVGVVEAKTTTQNPYYPVTNGFILKSQMQLQTKDSSRVRLDLSSGSIVRLGPLTIFSLDPQQTNTQGVLSKIELQVGMVWIILKGGTVDVNTPAGLASVRGSYMYVWVVPNSNQIVVTCLEGHCGFTDAAGSVDLTSGQKVISSDSNFLPTVEVMDQTDVQSWLSNNPEAAVIVTQIASLLASSTPLASSTLQASSTPLATSTPQASSTPYLTPELATYYPTVIVTPTWHYIPPTSTPRPSARKPKPKPRPTRTPTPDEDGQPQ